MSGGLRKRPNRPFEVRVLSTTVRDTQLSFRALGALTWILDQADGWDVRSDQMANMGKRADGLGPGGRPHRREGRDAVRASLRELAEAGYYRLERRRMRDGTTKMGTAVSVEPVESWAAQYLLFDRKPVPVVEQADGSFWVRYPDGTLQPDDWPAPAAADVSAGQTGDGFSGPGAPGPGSPGPGLPAPGEPAPDMPAPLVVPMASDHEVAPSPPPKPPVAVAADRPGAEEPDLVAEALAAAPHWSRRVLVTVLAEPDMVDRAARGPAAFARAVLSVATGRYGRTSSPRRILEDGPWWADAHGIADPAPHLPTQRCPGGCLQGQILVEVIKDGHPTGKDRPQPCPVCSPAQVVAA